LHVIVSLLLLIAEPTFSSSTASWEKAIGVSKQLRAEGRVLEARKVILAATEESSPSSARLACAYNELGVLAQQESMYAQAERDYRTAIRLWQSIPQDLGLARTLNNLASLLYLVGKPEAAERALSEAQTIQITAMGMNHPETARLLGNHATLHLSQRQYKRAELEYQKALEIWETFGSAHQLDIAGTVRGLAIIYTNTRRSHQAEIYNTRARSIWEAEVSTGHATLDIQLALAQVYLEAHEPWLAEPVLRQAILVSEATAIPNPFVAPALRLYATACRQTGFRAEARRAEQRARQIESSCSQVCLARQTVSVSELIDVTQSAGSRR
jgi:tetratricopeptide (TPR) repeat protein